MYASKMGMRMRWIAAAMCGWLGACAAPGPKSQPPIERADTPPTASRGEEGEASVRPGVNDKYLEAGAVETWTARFEHDGREVYDERAQIVAALGLEVGQRVVDYGSGTGLFTGVLAEAVGGSGEVVAVDIVPAFVEQVRAENAASPQVRVQLASARDPGLEAGRYDLIFMCDVYHHVEYPLTIGQALFDALRPGGQLVVVDFRRIEGVTSAPMLRHVRADQATVRAELEAAGFVHLEDRDWMRENYFMRLERPVAD